MGLGVANLEGDCCSVHEVSIYEKGETKRNGRPHLGQKKGVEAV